jgi:hypothetical protein
MEAMVLYSIEYDSIIYGLESGREYESRNAYFPNKDPGHQKKTRHEG